MTGELRLYGHHADGIRYLLAQSPDTKDLVPDIPTGAWEAIGVKKGVQVRPGPLSSPAAAPPCCTQHQLLAWRPCSCRAKRTMKCLSYTMQLFMWQRDM